MCSVRGRAAEDMRLGRVRARCGHARMPLRAPVHDLLERVGAREHARANSPRAAPSSTPGLLRLPPAARLYVIETVAKL